MTPDNDPIAVLLLREPALQEPLSRHLQRCGIPHRWQQVADGLQLEVADRGLVEPARRQALWLLRSRGEAAGRAGDWRQRVMTLGALALCTGLTLLADFGDRLAVLRWLTIVDFSVDGQYLQYQALGSVFRDGQYWRLLSPVFLHFGGLHLAFNMLWLWLLGGAIEIAHGRRLLLALMLVSGLVANLAQYPVSGPMFGGYSGIVYAMLGYCALLQRRGMGPILLPSGLYVFMLIWLVLGYTPFSQWLGLGRMANAAHLAGLLSGLAFAVARMMFSRRGD